jgi:hypothetical protein
VTHLWLRAPLLLWRRPGVAAALFFAALVAIAPAAAGPMLVSSAAAAALHGRVAVNTCPWTVGSQLTGIMTVDPGRDAAVALRTRTDVESRAFAAVPRVSPSAVTTVFRDGLLMVTPHGWEPSTTRLASRTGFAGHVKVLSGPSGDGLWVPSRIAAEAQLRVGDPVSLGAFRTTVSAVYADLRDSPVDGSFWCSTSWLYTGRPGEGTKSPVPDLVLASQATVLAADSVLGTVDERTNGILVERGVDVAGTSVPQAQRVADDIRRAQVTVLAGVPATPRAYPTRMRSDLDDFTGRSALVGRSVAPVVAALSVAGSAVGLLALAAATSFWVRRRRRELIVLATHGVGAPALGAKAVLETLPAVLLGAAAAGAGGWLAIRDGGPSPLLDPAAVHRGLSAAAAVLAGCLVVIVATAAMGTRALIDVSPRLRRSGLRHVPWELALVVVAAALWIPLGGPHQTTIAGDQAFGTVARIPLRLYVTPPLAVLGALILLARLATWRLSRPPASGLRPVRPASGPDTPGPAPGEGTAGRVPREGTAGRVPREGTAGRVPREGTAGRALREGAAAGASREEAAGRVPREGAAGRASREEVAGRALREGAAARASREAAAGQASREDAAGRGSKGFGPADDVPWRPAGPAWVIEGARGSSRSAAAPAWAVERDGGPAQERAHRPSVDLRDEDRRAAGTPRRRGAVGLLMWRRLGRDAVAAAILAVATGTPVGLAVFGATAAQTASGTLLAQAQLQNGADVVIHLAAPAPVPADLRGQATPVRRIDNVQLGDTSVSVLEIDPATFARGAYWDDRLGAGGIADLLAGVSPTRVVAASPVASGEQPMRSAAGPTLTVQVRAVPVLPASQGGYPTALAPTGIMDRLQVGHITDTMLWVRGDAADIHRKALAAHLPVVGFTDATSLYRHTWIEPVTYTFAYTVAVSALMGLITTVGLVLYLEAGMPARKRAWVMLRRMGLTPGGHWRSLLAQIAVPVACGTLLGAGFAAVAAVLTQADMDVDNQQPPGPLLAVPVGVLAVVGLVVVAVVATTVITTHLRTVRAHPSVVLRDVT